MRCSTCLYYEGYEFGLCRINPPTRSAENATGYWPLVKGEENWCGAHVFGDPMAVTVQR